VEKVFLLFQLVQFFSTLRHWLSGVHHPPPTNCTPSRYSLLTGPYNWRTLQKGDFHPIYNAPMPVAHKPALRIAHPLRC